MVDLESVAAMVKDWTPTDDRQNDKIINDIAASGILTAHYYRLKKYPNTIVGSELVDWLCNNNHFKERKAAVQWGNNMMKDGYIEHIRKEYPLRDGFFFYYLFRKDKSKDDRPATKVAIVHCLADKILVKKVVGALEKDKSFSICADSVPNEPWFRDVLAAAEYVVLVLSAKAAKNDVCLDQLKHAAKAHRKFVVLQVEQDAVLKHGLLPAETPAVPFWEGGGAKLDGHVRELTTQLEAHIQPKRAQILDERVKFSTEPPLLPVPDTLAPPKWVPDGAYAHCFHCGNKKYTKRKRHCRLCGEMFCCRCTTKVQLPPRFRLRHNLGGPQPVCFDCEDLCHQKANHVETCKRTIGEKLKSDSVGGDKVFTVPKFEALSAFTGCSLCHKLASALSKDGGGASRDGSKDGGSGSTTTREGSREGSISREGSLNSSGGSVSSTTTNPKEAKEGGGGGGGGGAKAQNCRVCGKLYCDKCTSKINIPRGFRQNLKDLLGDPPVCKRCQFWIKGGAKLVGLHSAKNEQERKATANDVAEFERKASSQFLLKVQSTSCEGCGKNYGIFLRRHKCTQCGQIRCQNCLPLHEEDEHGSIQHTVSGLALGGLGLPSSIASLGSVRNMQQNQQSSASKLVTHLPAARAGVALGTVDYGDTLAPGRQLQALHAEQTSTVSSTSSGSFPATLHGPETGGGGTLHSSTGGTLALAPGQTMYYPVTGATFPPGVVAAPGGAFAPGGFSDPNEFSFYTPTDANKQSQFNLPPPSSTLNPNSPTLPPPPEGTMGGGGEFSFSMATSPVPAPLLAGVAPSGLSLVPPLPPPPMPAMPFSAPMPLRPGDIPDGVMRFDILARLGEGSYGAVFKARDTTDGEEVAIKMLAQLDQQSADATEREINFLKTCQHPHIVGFKGKFDFNGKVGIVMEYCEGGSLNDVMDVCDITLTEEQIAAVMHQCLDALNSLHKHKKIHRDVKAANILLGGSGCCKIADFGVSADLDPRGRRKTMIGTPHWMAPEVFMGPEGGYDCKSDIWSVGITAMELAKGENPFAGVHPVRAVFHIPRSPPPTLADPENWSENFNSFLQACLQKEPNLRPTAEELLTLHPFVNGKDMEAKSRAVLTKLAKTCFPKLAAFRNMETDGINRMMAQHGGGSGGGAGQRSQAVVKPSPSDSLNSAGSGKEESEYAAAAAWAQTAVEDNPYVIKEMGTMAYGMGTFIVNTTLQSTSSEEGSTPSKPASPSSASSTASTPVLPTPSGGSGMVGKHGGAVPSSSGSGLRPPPALRAGDTMSSDYDLDRSLSAAIATATLPPPPPAPSSANFTLQTPSSGTSPSVGAFQQLARPALQPSASVASHVSSDSDSSGGGGTLQAGQTLGASKWSDTLAPGQTMNVVVRLHFKTNDPALVSSTPLLPSGRSIIDSDVPDSSRDAPVDRAERERLQQLAASSGLSAAAASTQSGEWSAAIAAASSVAVAAPTGGKTGPIRIHFGPGSGGSRPTSPQAAAHSPHPHAAPRPGDRPTSPTAARAVSPRGASQPQPRFSYNEGQQGGVHQGSNQASSHSADPSSTRHGAHGFDLNDFAAGGSGVPAASHAPPQQAQPARVPRGRTQQEEDLEPNMFVFSRPS